MKKYKILVADDDQMILDFITQVLEDENYEIHSALNGKIAYDLSVKYLPDLIIIDWNMPELNGIETMKILKKKSIYKEYSGYYYYWYYEFKRKFKGSF